MDTLLALWWLLEKRKKNLRRSNFALRYWKHYLWWQCWILPEPCNPGNQQKLKYPSVLCALETAYCKEPPFSVWLINKTHRCLLLFIYSKARQWSSKFLFFFSAPKLPAELLFPLINSRQNVNQTLVKISLISPGSRTMTHCQLQSTHNLSW